MSEAGITRPGPLSSLWCWSSSFLCHHRELLPGTALPLLCFSSSLLFSLSRENVETVVSVENKQDAVTSNGHDGRYLTAAADFR